MAHRLSSTASSTSQIKITGKAKFLGQDPIRWTISEQETPPPTREAIPRRRQKCSIREPSQSTEKKSADSFESALENHSGISCSEEILLSKKGKRWRLGVTVFCVVFSFFDFDPSINKRNGSTGQKRPPVEFRQFFQVFWLWFGCLFSVLPRRLRIMVVGSSDAVEGERG